MSDRRFILKDAHPLDRGECIFDSNQDKFLIEVDEVIKLLNSLEDDIQHLEEYCGDLEYDLKRFEKENERLRKELDDFKPVIFQDWRKGTVLLYSKGDSDG